MKVNPYLFELAMVHSTTYNNTLEFTHVIHFFGYSRRMNFIGLEKVQDYQGLGNFLSRNLQMVLVF